MNEITIPKKLESIFRAFCADSPEIAKALITQAAKSIYGSGEDYDVFEGHGKKKHDITSEELDGICALMEGIKPQDMLETLFASQIVVAHMLGMRKFAKGYPDDQRIGLKMLQFSNEAIGQLLKKRLGGMQNICVTYNHNGSGPALMQTVLQDSKAVNNAGERSKTLRRPLSY